LIDLQNSFTGAKSSKKRFKCDFFMIYPPDKKLPNVVKISAKINTMRNINSLLFVCSLSLASLKLCN